MKYVGAKPIASSINNSIKEIPTHSLASNWKFPMYANASPLAMLVKQAISNWCQDLYVFIVLMTIYFFTHNV